MESTKLLRHVRAGAFWSFRPARPDGCPQSRDRDTFDPAHAERSALRIEAAAKRMQVQDPFYQSALPSSAKAAAHVRFAPESEPGLPAREAREGWWAHKDSNLGPAD